MSGPALLLSFDLQFGFCDMNDQKLCNLMEALMRNLKTYAEFLTEMGNISSIKLRIL